MSETQRLPQVTPKLYPRRQLTVTLTRCEHNFSGNNKANGVDMGQKKTSHMQSFGRKYFVSMINRCAKYSIQQTTWEKGGEWEGC